MTALACLIALLANAPAAPAPVRPELTGEWVATVTTADGEEHELVLKMTRKGETLTGVAVQGGRDLPLQEGRVKGDEVTFTVEAQQADRRVRAAFRGKLSGDRLEGTVDARWEGGGADLDWRARRAARR